MFPTAALRQAHYMNTHRRDSSSKRARFAPIQPPTRGTHTPPSSPFLSRSVTEMHNPSPYDSGYDSSFSTASGPGQPPSSRGNSDIDDQVDRYIRYQRVTTIVMDPPLTSTTNPDPNTPSTTFTQPYQHHSHNFPATPHVRDHRQRRPPSNHPGQRHCDPISHNTFQPSLSTAHIAPSFDPVSPESLPPRAVRIHTSLPPHPRPPAARRDPTTGPTPSRRRRPTQYILFAATPHGRLQRRRRRPHP